MAMYRTTEVWIRHMRWWRLQLEWKTLSFLPSILQMVAPKDIGISRIRLGVGDRNEIVLENNSSSMLAADRLMEWQRNGADNNWRY